MENEDIWHTIRQERAELVHHLEQLDDKDWNTLSLCPGWTVRDVAAHVISSAQATPGNVLSAMVRGRGNFDRAIYLEAKRLSARPPTEILADFHRLDGSRHHPVGTTALEPLIDVLVHTQDILLPLGRVHRMPAEAACVAADRVWSRAFPFQARRRLALVQLHATDCAWQAGLGGEGREVRGPIAALLLLLTGRTALVPELSGSGLALLPGAAGGTP
jgi:uncharacterized protein (TIGR03083 family)